MAGESFKYDAFISYRHCELDSFISENLHKKLESYKISKYVLDKVNPEKTKIERVFRDEAELPLASNLSDPISEALSNSEFLIVICTPRLPESQWCKKEIETFVDTHDRQHVLLVLAEGEPEESFPDILMYEEVSVQDEDGKEVTVRVDREPLAADCRADTDKERLKALDNVVLKLCAAMFGLNYDDLKQRHRERQIRRRLIAMSAALAIVTVFAITCLSFSIKINRQNKIIQDKYAGSMAAASSELLSRGLRQDALYAVRNVLPDKERSGYNADAYRALSDAAAPYEVEAAYYPKSSFFVPQAMNGLSLSQDAAYALVDSEGYSRLIDTASGKALRRIRGENAVLAGNGVVYISSDRQVRYLDIASGEETVLSEEESVVSYSPDEDTVILFTAERISGYRDRERVFEINLADMGIDDPDIWPERIFITADGKFASFVLSGFDYTWIGLLDIAGGQLKMCLGVEPVDNPMVASDGETVYLYYEAPSENVIGEDVGMLASFSGVSGAMTAEEELPGRGFYDMLLDDNGLLLVSDRIAYIYDFDLTYLSAITGYADAVCFFPHDGGFGILDGSGQLRLGNLHSDYDASYLLYGHGENVAVSLALYSDDSFYVKYAGNDRLVVYERVPDRHEPVSDLGDAAAYDGSAGSEPELERLEGLDMSSVFNAGTTDDGKYIAVDSFDGALYIYDAADGHLVREIYDSGIALMHKVYPYLKEMDVYILENGVFDRNFNLISTLPRGNLAAIGKDGKSLFLMSPYEPDTYYNVTLLTYDEMIERADDLLNGYVPGKRICEKYNITEQ
ncbi:MAG: TIR domain-containing protein [Lachnospiraceae bacterium]|nr:TIR domain-containing protein [Lachnospiraceae bacterium]